MTILTEKTKETFEKWYLENHCKSSIKYENLLSWQKFEIFDWLYDSCETIQHAFYLEFFDSVGIFIQHFNSDGAIGKEYDADISYNGKMYSLPGFSTSRNTAVKQALEKANEIFNKQ